MKPVVQTVLILIAMAVAPAMDAAQPGIDQVEFERPIGQQMLQASPDPVAIESDIPYLDTDNPQHLLDLYLPNERKARALPVIVFIHGGGWTSGDKSSAAVHLIPLVRSGQYAGVSINYRFSSEAIWPAQLEDCRAAIRWVRENAEARGLDAEHIGVWGPSAGGHLALMVGLTGNARERSAKRDVDNSVAAIANFFGVTDMLALREKPDSRPGNAAAMKPETPEELLIGGLLAANRDKAKSASPITYVSADDPPVLTVHGDADPKIPYDQAVRLDAALRDAGVPSYFVTVVGGGHGNFSGAADDRLKAFFDRYLRGQEVRIITAPITEW